METDYRFRKNHCFYLSFLPKSRNNYSFQWKPFYYNMSNMPSIGSSFSISWKCILNESFITTSGNGFSVYWKQYSFIQIFLETIIAIRGKPIFLKKSYICYCSRDRFVQFFQILTRMEAFRFSEIALFKESFILADGNRFSIN